MPVAVTVVLGLFGVLYLVFAFVQPPEAIRHFFKVPAIFVFLPDRMAMPVGRFLMGVLLLVGLGVLWFKTHAV
jgi:hypothetical protein